MSGKDGPSRNPDDKSPPATPPQGSPLQQLLAEHQNRERRIQQVLQGLSEQSSVLMHVVQHLQDSSANLEQTLERYNADFSRRISEQNAKLDSMIQSTLFLSSQSRAHIDQERMRFEDVLRAHGVDLSNREVINALIQLLQQVIQNQGGDQQGGSGSSSSKPNQ